MLERQKAVRLCLFIVCLICVGGVGVAEEATYSPDSLMAAFKKGSTASIKGTEITFTGVVAEVKKSSVVFKSSENDKVICDLVSPLAGNGGPVVGQPFTVVGKVKGRGMLGNVTLDRCNTATTAVVSNTPAVDEPSHEGASAPAPVPEEPVKQHVEASPVEKKPVVVAAAKTAPVAPTRNTVKAGADVAAPSDAALPVRPEIPTLASPAPQEPLRPAPRRSSLPPGLLQAVGVAMVAVVVLFACMKFGPAFVARRRPADKMTVTEKVRRDALEALLSADKKK